MEPDSSVTQLISKSRTGNAEATDLLIPIVYRHLHAMAARYMRGERPNHTLTPTALLNEAYLKLAGGDARWEDRSHFFCIASRTMRQILVDHAKSRNRVKRGNGAQRVDLDEIDLANSRHDLTVIEIDEALTRLSAQDERKAKLIELLYFSGLTYQEAAEALNISEITVHRDVKFAKAWLRNIIGS